MDHPRHRGPRDTMRRSRSYQPSLCHFLISTVVAGLLASGCQHQQPVGRHEQIGPETAKSVPTVTADIGKPLAEFNQGAALLEQYQYAKAEEKFQSVVSGFPDWTAARFNLGLTLLNQPGVAGKLDRAVAEFQQVIGAEPDHRWSRFCLGVIYQHLGEFDKALDHLGKVHAIDPDDPFVGFLYAENLRQLGRDSEALGVLQNVTERDPGFVSAFYSLGMLYNRIHQRDKAVQILKLIT